MDWIIVLLIIVGVVSRAGKKKKQQAHKQFRQRQAGFDEAAKLQQGGTSRLAETLKDVGAELKAELQDELESGLMDELPLPVQKPNAPAVQARPASSPQPAPKPIYTRKEWQKLFASPAKPAKASKPAAPAAEPSKPAPKPRPAAPVAAPTIAQSSMEGESPLEHAAHKQRIAAEEERIHREHAQLQELRSANLQKLRSAVVMSEVLGKPVSLSPRGRR